jgi:hypothetical protein
MLFINVGTHLWLEKIKFALKMFSGKCFHATFDLPIININSRNYRYYSDLLLKEIDSQTQ